MFGDKEGFHDNVISAAFSSKAEPIKIIKAPIRSDLRKVSSTR